MPGVLEKQNKGIQVCTPGEVKCTCSGCPCKSSGLKYGNRDRTYSKKTAVFPIYKGQGSDTYSYSVYRKEMCNKTLMKQHAALAQKKISQRHWHPPVITQEPFKFKTTAQVAFKRYTKKDALACKAKYPRAKIAESFYYKPKECTDKFPQQSLSHEDYRPQKLIPKMCKKDERYIPIPPFQGISSYNRDYVAYPLDAYAVDRKLKKRVVLD